MANEIKVQPQKRLPQKYITIHAINGLFPGKATEDRVTPAGSKLTLEQLGEQNARMMLATGAVEASDD